MGGFVYWNAIQKTVSKPHTKSISNNYVGRSETQPG